MSILDDVFERIRTKGERITIPRQLVIDALCEATGHLSIAGIQAYLQQQKGVSSLSETTIYRILQWLKDLGLVSQTDMGKAGIVYALMRAPYHHHLICLTCGTVFTMEDSLFNDLRQRLLREIGFQARIDHMAIYGHCKDCSQSIPEPNGADT